MVAQFFIFIHLVTKSISIPS